MYLNLNGDSNPFETATRGNFSLAVAGCEYCTNALNARVATDEQYAPVATEMSAENLIYQGLFQKHLTALAKRGSDVGTVRNLFDDLKEHLADDWEYEISKVLRPGTPAYKFLFPKGIGPFKGGSQQNMTLAVQRLGEDLDNNALADLKTIIVDYGEQLENLTGGKDSQKVTVKDDSTNLEAGRVHACDVMLGIFGQALYFEKFNRERLHSLFPFALFERADSDFKEGAVAAGVIRQVKRQRSDRDVFVKLKSHTDTAFRFYRAAQKGDEAREIFIDVPAFQEVRVRLSALGGMELPLILVKNLSETEGGYYSFEMEEA